MKQLILILLVIFACAAPQLPRADAAQQDIRGNQVWYRMHLGTGVGDTAVSPDLMRAFIDAHITPKFPKGLTIIDARGQWSMKGTGLIRERTIVVELYCDDTEDNRKTVEEIAKSYVDRFVNAKASCFVTRVQGLSAAQHY